MRVRIIRRDKSKFFYDFRDKIISSKDPELIARQNDLIPADVMQEVCRFGAAEPHVVAAILGGCVAQEVIKLCTHQYVPVDNSIIFDGHSQQAASFRVIKQ